MIRQYEPSRYNFWVRLGTDAHLLFNGRSGALYRLNEQETRASRAALDGDMSAVRQETWDALVAGGFALPAGVNEIELMQRRRSAGAARPGTLELDICPTYECNFRCRYCYVEFPEGRMDRVTEERVRCYVLEQLARHAAGRIFWYGGEPLLCADTVVRLSSEFAQKARGVGRPLAITVLTNGFLLDVGMARALWDAGIRFLHVTIDGSEKCHDRLRPLADGTPTHARVLENVRGALEALPGLRLNLRINVGMSNYKSVQGLFDQLPDRHRARIRIDISPIHGPKSGCASAEEAVARFAPLVHPLIGAALDRGYRVADSQLASPRVHHCTAAGQSNFQIGPDGTLYKCSPWGKPEAKVGHLDPRGQAVLGPAFTRWHADDELAETCQDCRFLCFCGGGCRVAHLRGVSGECCKESFAQIDQMILNRYRAYLASSSQWRSRAKKDRPEVHAAQD